MTCETCAKARLAMWEKFKGWYSQPFSTEMSATDWFFFFGLFIAISVLWGLILRQLKELAE
jgi:hypothetical protein